MPRDYLSSVYREDCALFFFLTCERNAFSHPVCRCEMALLNSKSEVLNCWKKKKELKIFWPAWWKIVPKLKSLHKRTVNYRISVMEVFDMLCELKADYENCFRIGSQEVIF